MEFGYTGHAKQKKPARHTEPVRSRFQLSRWPGALDAPTTQPHRSDASCVTYSRAGHGRVVSRVRTQAQAEEEGTRKAKHQHRIDAAGAAVPDSRTQRNRGRNALLQPMIGPGQS